MDGNLRWVAPFGELWMRKPQGGVTSVHHIGSHEENVAFLSGLLVLVQIEGEDLHKVWFLILYDDESQQGHP